MADRELDELQLMRLLSTRKMVIRAQHLLRKVKVSGRETKLSHVVEELSLQPLGSVSRREKKEVVTHRMYVAETEVALHAPSLRGVARQELRRNPARPFACALWSRNCGRGTRSPYAGSF